MEQAKPNTVRTCLEEMVRVPFKVSWPGAFVSGRTVDANPSLVDLFPALCEACRGNHFEVELAVTDGGYKEEEAV